MELHSRFSRFLKIMIQRLFKIEDVQYGSVFLFGARQTGKTTLLLSLFPNSRFYDMLENDTYERLRRNPSLLRQELQSCEPGEIVIIDEIQLIPELLNEVHWLIARKDIHFILSGSSARKLKRKGVNTLGGRAVKNVLYPLVSAEIPEFDLVKAVNRGMLPTHYLAQDDRQLQKRLQAYISVYLKEEIAAEALVRRLPSFTRFMEVAERMQLSVTKTYKKMSRGERLKFQLAFAIAHAPCLYLLDEVTAGMDPVFRLDFFEILRELIQDETCSVLMTSHILSEVELKTDYVGIMEHGEFQNFSESMDIGERILEKGR